VRRGAKANRKRAIGSGTGGKLGKGRIWKNSANGKKAQKGWGPQRLESARAAGYKGASEGPGTRENPKEEPKK